MATGNSREIIQFPCLSLLMLEVGSHRTFLEPYGPWYPKAIGKIYELDRSASGSASGYEWGEKNEAFVKKMTLKTGPRFDRYKGGTYPITALSQTETPRGLVIEARIEYDPSSSFHLLDFEKRNGQLVTLLLYVDKTSATKPVWAKS